MRKRPISGLLLVFATLAAPLVSSPQDAGSERVRALQLAATALEDGDSGKAALLLKPLLDRSPHDAVALNLMGLVKAEQRDLAGAELLFRRAIRESGDHLPGPHVNLARLESASQPSEAIDNLKAALTIKPDDLQARTLLRSLAQRVALDASRSGKMNEAAKLLTQAQAASPRDAEISFRLGMILLQTERNRDAETALRQAVDDRPGYPEAMYALGRVYLAENEAPQAEQQMREYLRLKPADATAYYGLGYVLVAEQKLGEAHSAFEKSLQLQPDQTESLFQLGEIALEQGDKSTAEQYFAAVLKRDQHHGGALTGLGIIRFRNAEYTRAKEKLENAIACSPSYQKAHYFYGLTLAKLGDKVDSEREFELAEQLQKPHTIEPHL